MPQSISHKDTGSATVISLPYPKGEGGDWLIKVDTDVRAWALGIPGVNFCPSIRFWEVNFAWALGFWQFLTKNV